MILSRLYKVEYVGANPQGTFVALQGTHDRFQIIITDVEANQLRPLQGQFLKLTLEERSPSSAPPAKSV
jgi:hypothetical protein